jgi:hypothetical protein
MNRINCTNPPIFSPNNLLGSIDFIEKISLNDYRYGFNGKEKTDEVNGAGDSYDYLNEFRAQKNLTSLNGCRGTEVKNWLVCEG